MFYGSLAWLSYCSLAWLIYGSSVWRTATNGKTWAIGLILVHPCSFLLLSASASTEDSCPSSTTNRNPRRCGLYLARSTIPDAGLGVFTGVPHDIGSSVAPPEIAHQIILRFDDERGPRAPGGYYWYSLVHDYSWRSTVTGGVFEAEAVDSLVPGVGMATNSLSPLVNVRSVMGSIDSAGVNSNGKGPGSGAFSAYHGVTYVAERPLETGNEIFTDYGDSYFRGRKLHALIPLAQEFQRADEMISALWKALSSTLRDGQTAVGPEWQEVWDVILEKFVTDDRVRNALPALVTDIQSAATTGTPHQFLRGDNPRTLEWLEENGLCMDHLVVGTSNIPHAGRGAFAKRPFATGEMIHPLPLLHIPRWALNLYEIGNDEKEVVAGRQLLVNYCISHNDSSILLMPYSSTANFINHGGSNANAKLVWADTYSDPMKYHNEQWMNMSAEDLLDQRRTGLLMLAVASRHISEGEEVTIDYGPQWEQAWLQHVSHWPTGLNQKTAAEYNESEQQIRTIFEESYPPFVGTACHYRFGGTQDAMDIENNSRFQVHSNIGIVEGKDAHSVEFYHDLEQIYGNIPLIEQHSPSWIDHGGRSTMSGDHLRPCTIVARHTKLLNGIPEDMYTARMYNGKGTAEFDAIPTHIELFIKDIPRRAIIFIDRAGMSDQHHLRAFRQEIGFPDADNMWPEAWKNTN